MAVQKFNQGDYIKFKSRQNWSGFSLYLGYVEDPIATGMFHTIITNYFTKNNLNLSGWKYTSEADILSHVWYKVELVLEYAGVEYYLINASTKFAVEYFVFKNTYEELYNNIKFAGSARTPFFGGEIVTFDPKNLTKFGQPLGFEPYGSTVQSLHFNISGAFYPLKNFNYHRTPMKIDSVKKYEIFHRFSTNLFLIIDHDTHQYFIFNNFDDELHLSKRSEQKDIEVCTMSSKSYPLGGKVRYNDLDGVIVSIDPDTYLYTVYFEHMPATCLCRYDSLIYSGETDWRFEYGNRK